MRLIDALTEIPDAVVVEDESMKKHTTLGVGGCAKYFITVKSLFSLSQAITTLKEYQVKYRIIGGGSNLLVSDLGYDGAIIKLLVTDVYTTVSGVRAMAGASLKNLAEFCFSHGLAGTEALYSIPAKVGGAVVNNAGAFGQTISDHILNVETLVNGKIVKVDKHDCKFSYRDSRFRKTPSVIVAVNFNFPKKTTKDFSSYDVYRELEKRRKEAFPVGKTCGSVFRNPTGDYAGRLIEKANLKGFSIGGATISTKHANFIVCDKTATSMDVDLLIKHVKKSVKQTFGVSLKEEVERLGVF